MAEYRVKFAMRADTQDEVHAWARQRAEEATGAVHCLGYEIAPMAQVVVVTAERTPKGREWIEVPFKVASSDEEEER